MNKLFKFLLLCALVAVCSAAPALAATPADIVDARIEAQLAAIHAGEQINASYDIVRGDREHPGYLRLWDGSNHLGTLATPSLDADATYTLPAATAVLASSTSALTAGSVPYAGTGGVLASDTELLWTNTANAKKLTIGSGTAGGTVELEEPSGSGTDLLRLVCPALAAATVITPPNATSTLATLALSETLTNKTVSGPSCAVTGALTSSGASAGIGYATGAGGAVTQLTNKSTGVTMVPNPCSCGTITMNNAELAGDAEVTFTVTNSAVAANDVVVVSVKSGASTGNYFAFVRAVGAGTFDVTVSNVGATASEVVVINFVVIKSVTS